MAITSFADVTAAQAGGYKAIQQDRGVGKSPRYSTLLEKWLVGEPGSSGFMFRAQGDSDVSQAAADAQAVTSLNGQRKIRFGGSSGRPDGATTSTGSKGGTHTDDVS